MTGENKNLFYVEIWWISREGTAGVFSRSINHFFDPVVKLSICVWVLNTWAERTKGQVIIILICVQSNVPSPKKTNCISLCGTSNCFCITVLFLPWNEFLNTILHRSCNLIGRLAISVKNTCNPISDGKLTNTLELIPFWSLFGKLNPAKTNILMVLIKVFVLSLVWFLVTTPFFKAHTDCTYLADWSLFWGLGAPALTNAQIQHSDWWIIRDTSSELKDIIKYTIYIYMIY